jgi:transcriptional regulator with XRE-family HTH domain
MTAKGHCGVGRTGVVGFEPARLRAARERTGLTQRGLAERLLQVTRPNWPGGDIARAAQDIENVRLQLHDYEAGDVTPRPAMVRQIAKELGVDVLELVKPETPYTLQLLRARHGMRQADVAESLGLSPAYYGRVERAAVTLSDECRRRLAEVLGVDPGDVDLAIAGTHTVASHTGHAGSADQRGRGQRAVLGFVRP